MTVFTPAHRDRLAQARDRKRDARQKMNAAKQAIQIATEHGDPSAAGHAEIALEFARGEEQMRSSSSQRCCIRSPGSRT